jgi:tetratricopeptide (TPR) repeat protein
MESAEPSRNRWLDLGLRALLGTLAFGLGCVVMFDSDVWWHVRAGEWILERGRVPRVDPFSFASVDRPWVDLHWGFQVALALAHRAGGVAGMIALAAGAGAVATLVAVSASRRDWASSVIIACWLPALLLMSGRLDPRPELFSLVFLAGVLAILRKADEQPRWLWAIPPLQAIWANCHALFVLGLLVLGAFLVDRLARKRLTREARWSVVIPAALLSGLACLATPYGVEGLKLPVELAWKISDPDSPFKQYVEEFLSLKQSIARQTVGLAAGDVYVRSLFFLENLLPATFLLPAVWKSWRARAVRGRPALWSLTLLASVALALLSTTGLPAIGASRTLVRIGELVPFAWAGLGILGAIGPGIVGRNGAAAGLAGVGGLAVAAWSAWLRASLFDPNHGFPGLGVATVLLGPLALGLAIREGASLYRMLLAVGFGGLALLAVRNLNLFALVAGWVLASNLGEWLGRVGADWDGRMKPRLAFGSRIVLALGLTLGLVALGTGRFPGRTGEPMAFGLHERPFQYAHDAARALNAPGMPARVLALDLGQTGTVVYHLREPRLSFMDARLEVPSVATFQLYVRMEAALNEGDRAWVGLLDGLGDLAVLVGHEGEAVAEASLLASPAWRCVWFDAVAAIFVRADHSGGLPTVDFHARHFTRPLPPTTPNQPGGRLAEATALGDLGTAVRRFRVAPRKADPILLLGASRALEAIGEDPRSARAWTALGACRRGLAPAPRPLEFDPSAIVDPAEHLGWAEATFCFRQATELDPRQVGAWLALHDAYALRGMKADQTATAQRIKQAFPDPTREPGPPPPSPPAETSPLDLPWPEADRLAWRWLDRGYPAMAERVWSAAPAPSAAIRECRIGFARLVAQDDAAAYRHFVEGSRVDPTSADAWFGRALVEIRAGRRDVAREATLEALRRDLTAGQRAWLERFGPFLGIDPGASGG